MNKVISVTVVICIFHALHFLMHQDAVVFLSGILVSTVKGVGGCRGSTRIHIYCFFTVRFLQQFVDHVINVDVG